MKISLIIAIWTFAAFFICCLVGRFLSMSTEPEDEEGEERE